MGIIDNGVGKGDTPLNSPTSLLSMDWGIRYSLLEDYKDHSNGESKGCRPLKLKIKMASGITPLNPHLITIV